MFYFKNGQVSVNHMVRPNRSGRFPFSAGRVCNLRIFPLQNILNGIEKFAQKACKPSGGKYKLGNEISRQPSRISNKTFIKDQERKPWGSQMKQRAQRKQN